MVDRARNVRSRSQFAGNPLAPLNAQDFLDFFKLPSQKADPRPAPPRTDPLDGPSGAAREGILADASRAPEGLRRYAPAFLPKQTQETFQVRNPLFGGQAGSGDVDYSREPAAVDKTVTRGETGSEVLQRAGRTGGRRFSAENPLWKQAYDAALIQFNREKDVRQKDEAKRKEQRENRREREDRELGGGVGSPSGTTLITGAQGFLGGQGGAGSLLK